MSEKLATIVEEEIEPTPAHLGGSYEGGDGNTTMPDVWGYLIVKFGIKSMIDIGCGHGHAMKWFSDMLVHCIGIDGDPFAVKKNLMPPHHVLLHDYTKGEVPDTFIPKGSVWDLAWSAEFLEHVDADYIPNYMETFRHCRYAVVTHAEPGQHGHHHVACFPDEFWIQVFAEGGFIFDPKETTILRATDRWHAGWGRRSLMFFKRL